VRFQRTSWYQPVISIIGGQDAAALAFVAMGMLIGREAAQAGADESAQGVTCSRPDDQSKEPSAALVTARDWKAFGSTFGLLSVAEMGDKTQLAILGLAGKRAEFFPVFIGGALALTTVTACGVIGGQ